MSRPRSGPGRVASGANGVALLTTSPTACARVAPNCSLRQRTSAATSAGCERPRSRPISNAAARLTSSRPSGVRVRSWSLTWASGLSDGSRSVGSGPNGPRYQAVAASPRRDVWASANVTGLGQLGRGRPRGRLRVGKVDVLDLLGRVRTVRVDREHRPVLGAEESHVERLDDRAEVTVVGRGERPVGQHREAVRLLQHEGRDLDGPAARHLLAHRDAGVDGLERRGLGGRRGRRAGPRRDRPRCRPAWPRRRRRRRSARAIAASASTSSTSSGTAPKRTGCPVPITTRSVLAAVVATRLRSWTAATRWQVSSVSRSASVGRAPTWPSRLSRQAR